MMQCLNGLVGITNSTCDCVIKGKTEDELLALRASSSQLYMNKLPGGIDLSNNQSFGTCADLLSIAKDARDQAIIDFENRLTEAVNVKYKGSKKKYTGLVGEMSAPDSINTSLGYQGAVLRPKEYTDGVITLKALQIILNAPVAITVRVFRVIVGTVMGEEVNAWPVNTLANTFTSVNIGTDPIEYPLIYNNQSVEYYFAYDLSGLTARPLSTKFTCNCPGRVYGWKDYVTAQGFQVGMINMLNTKQVDADYTRGLIFNLEIRCDSAKLFCREYDAYDAISKVIGVALWNLSGFWLIQYVMKSRNINPLTTSDKEYNWGYRNHFLKEATDRIDKFLAETINITDGNCFVCKEVANQPYFSTILI